MSLMDTARAEVDPIAEATAEVTEAPKSKGSSYQKKARERAIAAAVLVKNYMVEKKLYENAPADVKDAIDTLTHEKTRAASTAFGKPVIYTIFGDSPKKGAKITTLEVFQKCGKGYAEMRGHIRKWEKSGIIVRLDEKTATYVLDSDVPAFTE